MNDLLQLKGQFHQSPSPNKPGPRNIPDGKIVTLEHLESLLKDLEKVSEFWSNETLLPGALVSIRYIDIIAKSNRVQGFFSRSGQSSNSSVVGAKFFLDEKIKHIITHYIDLNVLYESINKMRLCIQSVKKLFGEEVNHRNLNEIDQHNEALINFGLSKTSFVHYIVDAYYVEFFYVNADVDAVKDSSIISLYNTKTDTSALLNKLEIRIAPGNILDNTTILLTPPQFELLREKAPYLISMAVSDLSSFTKDDFDEGILENNRMIPSPQSEPTIGVIDTLFDDRVYFSDWVEYVNKLPKDIEIEKKDFSHGTEVSSIIVDGPALNPDLDDGCGRFKVRHFGVAKSGRFSSFTILKSIQEIISANKDIKVWNLSLGSDMEVNPNFISPEAALLDEIQHKNDVIFIVAGTNKTANQRTLGAPADSINSLVVNSVDFKNISADYSREGPVLSFFNKPDVSYYGGTTEKKIKVYSHNGEKFVAGTSYAAPWIARKIAYLIHVVGLSREVAKALIIDAAAGWKDETKLLTKTGYGVVPVKIKDIIGCPNDEIKFVMSGFSEKYNTYSYNLPVPIDKDKYPFIAKATLCYFPHCSRNQGVDYTNTELDIYLGRVNGERIKSINKNSQSINDGSYMYEGSARRLYRKWDNVKHIKEVDSVSSKPRKVYESRMWGISVKAKERTEVKYGSGNFGLVITLKELEGKNRINEFINLCSLRGWLVSRINIENQIDIYLKAEENILFEE